MDREEFQKAYGKLVAKAWADEEFKAKLLADPMAVFVKHGIEIPEGIECRVVENTDTIVHLVLMQAPTEELSDEELSTAAGGWCACGCYSTGFGVCR